MSAIVKLGVEAVCKPLLEQVKKKRRDFFRNFGISIDFFSRLVYNDRNMFHMYMIPLKEAFTMFCPNCGANNGDGAKFCNACGFPMPSGSNSNADPSSKQTQSNQAKPDQGQPNQTQPNQGQSYQQYQAQPNQGFAQNTGYAAPEGMPGGYRANIQNRNLALCIILSIVTCGIYGIIWMINLVNDLNTASGCENDTSGGMVFLLSLVTCGIYSYYWAFKAGEKIGEVHRRNGAGGGDESVLYLVLSLFGFAIVVHALIQNELNKVASFS